MLANLKCDFVELTGPESLGANRLAVRFVRALKSAIIKSIKLRFYIISTLPPLTTQGAERSGGIKDHQQGDNHQQGRRPKPRVDQGARISCGSYKATLRWYQNQRCQHRRTSGCGKFTRRNNNQRYLNSGNRKGNSWLGEAHKQDMMMKKRVRMKKMIRTRCNKKGRSVINVK